MFHFRPSAMLVNAYLALIIVVACDSADHAIKRYSIFPSATRVAYDPFNQVTSSLKRVVAIGSLEGQDEYVFGVIADVAVGDNGTIYVADPKLKRVSVYSSGGEWIRQIGKEGRGPGEVVAPFGLALAGNAIAVFDQATGTVSVFDTTGIFQRTIYLAGTPTGLASGPSNTLLVTLSSDSARILRYDLSGNLVGKFLTVNLPSGNEPRLPPNGGLACSGPDSVVFYVTPWIHETGAFTVPNGKLQWLSSFSGTPLSAERTAPSLGQPSTMLLGFRCTPHGPMVAYVTTSDRRIAYDFIQNDGRAGARMVFMPTDTVSYPGYPAHFDTDRWVTFRNRPYPQVLVFSSPPGYQ
jgi:hypothetical protein